MKNRFLISLLFVFLTPHFCSFAQQSQDSSIVYFTRDISPEGVMKIFQYVKDSVHGNVGIKVHFGEDGNEYFVPATMVKPLCEYLNATLIETNVAYRGRRRNSRVE